MDNFESLVKKLLKASKDIGDVNPVVVGYTAEYAGQVHEDLATEHKIGEAKFLEKPAYLLGSELSRVALNVIKLGGTLQQGLLAAGLRLQRESQLLVPVDTGALRASAFTEERK